MRKENMMKNSKQLLEEIEKDEKKNREDATRILQAKNKVYQGMAIECIKKVFKCRDDLKKPFKTFVEVNDLLAELQELYPGYLSFLQKADSWKTDFDPAEVRYLIDYLLTGKWSKDGEFWRVMSQIADTIDMKGNPFKLIEG